MKMKFVTTLAVVFIALMSGRIAQATPFTVYGSDSPDQYTVTGPGFIASIPVIASPKATPWVAGSWMAPSYDQAWPMTLPQGNGNLKGEYDYVTTFNLAGFNPATAVLTGEWASDNVGVLFLNGIKVSQSDFFTEKTTFDIHTGFVAGLNTLDFKVTNDPYGDPSSFNPTGLFVSIAGDAAPVPEPSTFILFGAGLAGVAFMRKRKKK